MLIVNAQILPVVGEEIAQGFLQIENGKIVSLGPMAQAPADGERYDAAGALALPAATSATQAAPAFGLAATVTRAPSLVDLDATKTGSITIHKLVKDDTNGTAAGNGLKDDTATGEQ